MIGTKISGNPTPSSMRDRAMNQKPRSAYTLVMPYMESAIRTAPATIRYLGCTLAATRPTTNIITMVTTPPGESTRPAKVAVQPKSCCTSCGKNCVVASRIAPVVSITRKQAPNWRVATMRRSMIGLPRVNPHGIISTNARPEMTANVTMKGEPNQSSSRPRSSTTSRAPRRVAIRMKPTTSNPLPCCEWLSACAVLGSRRTSEISAIAITPTGTLIRKHHCQETLSDNQPPSVGPTTGATTTATPNSAKAWPRFAGGNKSARIDWATGTMPPPPTPCMIRNSNTAFRFAAKPSRQIAAGRQDDGIGDQIGGDHPGGFVLAHPHAARNVGQRHVGDRGVEHLHKTRERDQDGDQPGIDAGAACRGSIGFDDGSAHKYLLNFSTSDDVESTRTVGTTDMPGPSATSGGGLSMMILTGTRWTILT